MRKCLIYIWPLLLISCGEKAGLFDSYGPDITETRIVGEFTKVKAGEKFDIFLVQDTAKAGTLEITAGKNVIKGYTTQVSDGQLLIRNENTFNWVRKLKVRQRVVVYFKNLSHLDIHGSAKFVSQDTIVNTQSIIIKQGGLEDAELIVKGDYIFIDCANTGGVKLKGTCFLMSASVDDISFVDAYNLKAQKAYLVSFSRDNSSVYGTEVVDIALHGDGSVYFKKEPLTDLTLYDDGLGQIIEK